MHSVSYFRVLYTYHYLHNPVYLEKLDVSTYIYIQDVQLPDTVSKVLETLDVLNQYQTNFHKANIINDKT